jgi:hypothetical protein
MEAVGLEVRPNNFANCCYVKERTSLPNLVFVNDDAWNVDKYGVFDIVFCCGLRRLHSTERLLLSWRLDEQEPGSKVFAGRQQRFNLSPALIGRPSADPAI